MPITDATWSVNPSFNLYDALGFPVFGGQHYVYVMQHKVPVHRHDHACYSPPTMRERISSGS
ncbi:MAG: hypothetical protein MZU84_06570 [Sphingobacterium sp.]|nr:hypothetical protein [Sphingobacterium sp.]